MASGNESDNHLVTLCQKLSKRLMDAGNFSASLASHVTYEGVISAAVFHYLNELNFSSAPPSSNKLSSSSNIHLEGGGINGP